MQRVISCGRESDGRRLLPHGFLPGVLAIALCGGGADARAQGSVESDRTALTALYDSADGPNWTESTNWNSDAPLNEWFGVITDSDGRVTNLFLVDNGLSGALPPELGDLTRLAGLSLSQNALTGDLPIELRNLANLKELLLPGNQLTGSIPARLGDLAKLETLNLAGNSLTGSIPATLGNLVNLSFLDLSVNNFGGPVPAALGDLTNLTTLVLANSGLTGSIPPTLGDLANLELLILGNFDVPFGGRNALVGQVPSTLGNLRNLGLLWLQTNRLEGELPASLTNLTLGGHLTVRGDQPTLRFEDNAGLCAPTDGAFQAWLNSLRFGYTGPVCGTPVPAVPAAALILLALMLVGAGLRARRSAA